MFWVEVELITLLQDIEADLSNGVAAIFTGHLIGGRFEMRLAA